MNIFKNLYLFNKKSENNKDFNDVVFDNYLEIAKLLKEARIQKNLTIKELSQISRINEQTLMSIENNLCASITSNILFISVAESTDIFFPIFHLG